MPVKVKSQLFNLSNLSDEDKVDFMIKYRDKQMSNFAENEEEIKFAITRFYDEQQNIFESASADEQVMQISRLHAMAEFSGWVLGEFLLRIEDQIQNPNDPRKQGYKTLSDWFDKNSEFLPFGRSAMYNYISIRKKAELSDFIALGVKGTIELTKIESPEIKKEVVQAVKEQKLTVPQIKSLVQKKVDQEIEREFGLKLKQKEQQKKLRNKVHFDVTIRGNKITITAEDTDEASLLNDVLLELEPQIKDRLLRKLNR